MTEKVRTSIVLSEEESAAIQDILADGCYIGFAEFSREAVREFLEELEIIASQICCLGTGPEQADEVRRRFIESCSYVHRVGIKQYTLYLPRRIAERFSEIRVSMNLSEFVRISTVTHARYLANGEVLL